MCLFVKSRTSAVIEKVKAYKLMAKFGDTLYSPFSGYKWEENILIESGVAKIEGRVSQGYIHAAKFNDEEAFIEMLLRYKYNMPIEPDSYGVIECELGGDICFGFDELHFSGYAATECTIFPETYMELYNVSR